MTEQLAALPLPLSVQLDEGLKVPVPLLVKLTVPVGVVAPELAVSVTVAVQVVDPLTGTVPGVQLTVVLVECMAAAVTVTVVLPLLGACVLSPV